MLHQNFFLYNLIKNEELAKTEEVNGFLFTKDAYLERYTSEADSPHHEHASETENTQNVYDDCGRDSLYGFDFLNSKISH